jgi:hypothetical protein
MTMVIIADIIDRLPPDGQKWLRKMERQDRQATEYPIKFVGADNFVEHWRFHKETWEHIAAGDIVVVLAPCRPTKSSTSSAPVVPYSYPTGRW